MTRTGTEKEGEREKKKHGKQTRNTGSYYIIMRIKYATTTGSGKEYRRASE